MDSPMDKIHASVEAVRSQSLTSLLPQGPRSVYDRAVFDDGRASTASTQALGPPVASVSRLDTKDNTHLLREALNSVAARLAVRAHRPAA
jgi:cytochrome c peroxidase